MNKTLLILIFMSILLCSAVLAEDLIYSRFSEIDLKIPCSNNNTPCSNETICNLTITYPNGSLFVDNQESSYNVGYFNYTLSDSSFPGVYSVFTFCNDEGVLGDATFTFKISSTGQKENDPLALVIGYGIMAILFLLIAFMIGKEHIVIQLFFLIFAAIITILVIPSVFISDIIPITVFSLSSKYVFYLFGAYILIYPVVYFVLKLLKRRTMEDE